MICHVLRFSFKDEATERDIAAALLAMEKLGEAPSVSFSCIGRFLGDPTEGFTHSAIYGMKDLAMFEHYMYEPVHRQADFVVHPLTKAFQVFDLADDDDVELKAKISAIQQQRVEADPELRALIAEGRSRS